MTEANQTEHSTAPAPEWQERRGRTPVRPLEWGRDHWDLLSYLETRVVDHQGAIGWESMVISQENWPMLFGARLLSAHHPLPFAPITTGYALRLKPNAQGEPVTLAGHCEVDAMMDLADHELITLTMPRADLRNDCFLKPNGLPIPDSPSPALVTGYAELVLMPYVQVGLTDAGWSISAELRRRRGTRDAYTYDVASKWLKQFA